jgi:putative ABC transport system ATP-binding protein
MRQLHDLVVPRPLPRLDAAVEARGVIKEFGAGETRIRVLHGVDLDIALGEVTFLVGASGSGKTTLISIIAGILTPEGGTVRVFGEELSRLSSSALAAFRREKVGFIFQQFNLLPALTAAENAAVPLLAQGVAEAKAVPRAKALLEQLGLAEHVNKFPPQLSGGQQQRIAIARSLIHGPSLLVCDEPTASLDAQSGQTAMTLLREAALDVGRAVVVVTHDSRIFRFADRMARISDGRITSIETPPFTEAH